MRTVRKDIELLVAVNDTPYLLHDFGHGISMGVFPSTIGEVIRRIVNDRIEGEMANADMYEMDEDDE